MAIPVPRKQPQPQKKAGSDAKMVNTNQWNSPLLNIPAVNQFLSTLGVPVNLLQPQSSQQNKAAQIAAQLGLFGALAPSLLNYLGNVVEPTAGKNTPKQQTKLNFSPAEKEAFSGFGGNLSLNVAPATNTAAPNTAALSQTTNAPTTQQPLQTNKDKLDAYSLRLQQAAMYGNTPQEKIAKVNQQIALWLSNGVITPEDADYLRQEAAIWLPAPQQEEGLFGGSMDKLIQLLLLISLLKQ